MKSYKKKEKNCYKRRHAWGCKLILKTGKGELVVDGGSDGSPD